MDKTRPVPGAANATHPRVFVTGIVALPGPGRPSAQLLDVMPGRTKAVVQQWFNGQDARWRDRIGMCSLDPFRGYASALSTSLPHAVRVLDAFHVVRLGSGAVGDVRRRRQQETLGRRGIGMTDSTAPNGCCAATSPPSPSGGGPGWSTPSSPATAAVSSPTAGWSPKSCSSSTDAATTCPRRGTGCGGSWTAAPAPRSPNCCGWHAP